VNPPPFATHWAHELGVKEESLIQLKGGINNRVYRCGEGVESYVIKGYEPAECGKRDRMKSEVDFLGYAAIVAPHFVPRLHFCDWDRRCVVLEHLNGNNYTDGSAPTATDLEAAVTFFRLLNSENKLAREWIEMDAAEGFLSLREHLANIRDRINAMCVDHLPKTYQDTARDLLFRIKEASEAIENNTEVLITSGLVSDAINVSERSVSPSDFGFHNAIRTSTGVKFFDFEFAGWDDPAKAAADFLLQPRVPVRLTTSPLYMPVAEPDPSMTKHRAEALGLILRLKWTAIILAILQPKRMNKLLENTNSSDVEQLTEERLTRAAHYFREESPFGLHRLHVAVA
jgi:hypothetical protein